ncbi:uncharacterized protein B0H18DRAFT_841959, partial [Fomitopsis serialis]|uniref:uncharacterized protein n=1 Tax=Fomitopsis serialis TaxID=139415 RepID=UPI002007D913
SKTSKCIRNKHNAYTVGEVETVANLRTQPGHITRNDCVCTMCRTLREEQQCEHPDACAKRAIELINQLPTKWNPRSPQPEDIEEQQRQNREENQNNEPDQNDAQMENAPEQEQGEYDTEQDDKHPDWEIFDPIITTHGSLGDIFRVFTTGETTNEVMNKQLYAQTDKAIKMATDGSCIENENTKQAGAGGFAGEQNPINFSIRIPTSIRQTNQTGELIAT